MKTAHRSKNDKVSGHHRRSRHPHSRAWKIIYVPIILLLLINGLFIYSLIERARQTAGADTPEEAKQVFQSSAGQTIRVEVLNGSGRAGVAKEMTDFLRARGFDVVNFGNAESQCFYETVVLDRSGDQSLAEQLAGAIGARQVLEQKNPYLALDVTLILGRDYRQLVPFAGERSSE